MTLALRAVCGVRVCYPANAVGSRLRGVRNDEKENASESTHENSQQMDCRYRDWRNACVRQRDGGGQRERNAYCADLAEAGVGEDRRGQQIGRASCRERV